MNKFLTRKSAKRHLIMLGITVFLMIILYTVVFLTEYRPCLDSAGMIMAAVIACAAGAVPAYWGSKYIFPKLAPMVWKSFVAAIFSLPIINLFAPKKPGSSYKSKSFDMQLEEERMRAERRRKMNSSPGLAVSNMAMESESGDFLLNLIFRPVIFCLWFAAFVILHALYLAVTVGILALFSYLLREVPTLAFILCAAGIVCVAGFYVVHPILSYIQSTHIHEAE